MFRFRRGLEDGEGDAIAIGMQEELAFILIAELLGGGDFRNAAIVNRWLVAMNFLKKHQLELSFDPLVILPSPFFTSGIPPLSKSSRC